MDIKKDCMIPECGNLPIGAGFRVIAGAKQLRKALNNGTARQVFLARNADPALTEPIEVLCQTNHISYTWVQSMLDLGHACGIDVGTAAAAVVD